MTASSADFRPALHTFMISRPTDHKYLYDQKLQNTATNKERGKGGGGKNLPSWETTAESICLPLFHIFSKSMNDSGVPSDWKRANVSVILKKDLSKIHVIIDQ